MPSAENSSQSPVPAEPVESTGVTPIDTERLRALLAASTPGPWGWRGHDDGTVELRGHGPCGAYDGRIVSAMRSEPCIAYLADESLALSYYACDTCRNAYENTDLAEKVACEKAENLGTVWPRGEVAIEPANKWAVREVPYRGDVVAVDHPDARLIAEARNALPALLDEVDRLRAVGGELAAANSLLDLAFAALESNADAESLRAAIAFHLFAYPVVATPDPEGAE